MGYRFAGFFAPAYAELIQDTQRQWPGCDGWAITDPFAGIMVRSPDLERADTQEHYDAVQAAAYALEDDLPQWSARYPGVRFVFVAAECFGGNCLYRGFVCQNGRVEAMEPLRARGAGTLARLMAYLGVQLSPDEYFAPFERGFAS